MNLKNSLIVLIPFTTFFISTLAAASPTAIVDSRLAIEELTRGSKKRRKVEALAKQRRAELEAEKASIEQQQKKLVQSKDLLSGDAFNQKQLKLREEARQFQRRVMAVENELMAAQNNITKPVIKRLREAVKRVAEAGSHRMVLDKESAGIWFSADSLDITEQVIAEYQNLSKKK